MEREEALSEFLKGLRIAISNSSAYPPDHPYYIKSIEAFKQKIEVIFIFLDPIKLTVATDSLLLDGKNWDKLAFYTELASMLHLRKIRAIAFKAGLTTEELIAFLTAVSLPTKKIFRQGGLRNILNKETSRHILVEELDYSLLLKGEGDEFKDIWLYLVNEAIEKKDDKQIANLSDHFESLINKFKISELLDDEELKTTLNKFFLHLDSCEKQKFSQCMGNFLETLLKYGRSLSSLQIEKLKSLFEKYSARELADILLRQIATNDNFDSLSLDLFVHLLEKEKTQELAQSLEEKLSQDTFKHSASIIKKSQKLLSESGEHAIPEIYHKILSAFIKNASSGGSFVFDRQQLKSNYRYMLLSLLDIESEAERLKLIAKTLLKELPEIIQEKDALFLKSTWEVLQKRAALQPLVLEPLFQEIARFFEEAIWEDNPSESLTNFIAALGKSYVGSDFYLAKIFSEGKVTPLGLGVYFKFFPSETQLFYENLSRRNNDLDLLTRLIRSLKSVDSPLVLKILESIYSFVNPLLKIEVLKSMQELACVDEGFLLPILNEKDAALKKEALLILAKAKKLNQKILSGILLIPSPFGWNNDLILENLEIIEEIDARDSRELVLLLSKKRFFWNRRLRNKAIMILRKWDADTSASGGYT